MKCEICGREANSRFCDLHEEAYRNLLEKYEVWKGRLDITWNEYLRRIIENPNTGIWAKEVAKHLSSQKRRDDGR